MRKEISIVAVADTKINETIISLRISSRKINCKKVILLSSANIDTSKTFKELEVIKIKSLNSLKDYNHFIIYELHKYIQTSHIILVQWDGFILNQDKWVDDFLKYDYIGAPFIPRAENFKYSRDKYEDFYCIGNGGFSLRSLSLLKAPSKYKLEDNALETFNHEDGFFSVYYRKFLESKGFKWAPFSLAKRFSVESPITFKEFINLPFGFHGKKLLKLHPKILFLRMCNYFHMKLKIKS